MRHLVVIVIALLCTLEIKAQSVQVVQLEHSLRWASELNFPAYVQDEALEASLLDEIGDRVSASLNVTDITFPAHVSYRLIGGFGKSKIKFPKSSSAIQIAIASSITRATTGYSMHWSMEVVIKKNGKVILDKEVEHEMEPYSVSIRFSSKPWFSGDEFLDTFLFLLEECLGTREYASGTLTFGSLELVRKQIEKIIPIANEYTLAVAGGIMTESNSSYKLMKDSVALHDFFYKDKDEWDFSLTFAPQAIFPKIFSSITGIESYYKLNSKEKRFGTLLTGDGIKRKMRLDWLEEVRLSAIDDETVDSRIISAIAGQFFEGDSLLSHFIVYSEKRPIENFSLRDAHFQVSDQDWSETIFTITGEYRKQPFTVTYNEAEAIILISVADTNQAVLSVINSNPKSMSAGGIRLTKNKRFIVGELGQSSVEVAEAEWYPFYVVENVNEDAATEMTFILMLLFFAVGQTGG